MTGGRTGAGTAKGSTWHWWAGILRCYPWHLQASQSHIRVSPAEVLGYQTALYHAATYATQGGLEVQRRPPTWLCKQTPPGTALRVSVGDQKNTWTHVLHAGIVLCYATTSLARARSACFRGPWHWHCHYVAVRHGPAAHIA